jgi:hypothetical protein
MSKRALEMPALNHEPVTEWHARYCRENGHATHRVDGFLEVDCPRCGEMVWTGSLPTVKSSELQLGDVVHAYGMQVKLDRTPSVYKASHGEGNAYSWNGAVLNPDQRDSALPESWLYPDQFVAGQGWIKDKSGGPRWTIQGNDLVRWTIEPRKAV